MRSGLSGGLIRAAATAVAAASWLLAPRATEAADAPGPAAFYEKHCHACHSAPNVKGGLDLTALPGDAEALSDPATFAKWVKVLDRVATGEMPPAGKPRPPADAVAAVKRSLTASLLAADRKRIAGATRTPLRRLTREEYENTVRDLFDLPGIPLKADLPADGSVHGFDKHADALDLSAVNLAKYMEAADRVLDMAIATRPAAPPVLKQRISLATPAAGVAHVMLFGEAVMLRNGKTDTVFPPASGKHHHLDQAAHQQMGMFDADTTVGLFRSEDESFSPYFLDFAAMHPARYRLRISMWSFHWNKGVVEPTKRVEAGRLSVIHLGGDGRHTGHPSDVIGYFDAPAEPRVHDLTLWLNRKDTIGFNVASLSSAPHRGGGHATGFKGQGIAVDWFEVEGPLHDVWPPRSHKRLFGDLPLVEFKPAADPRVRPPARTPLKQEIGHAKNRPEKETGVWTVASDNPLADADRLLGAFLPRAFRRPVDAELRRAYVKRVEERLAAGDCFETAMRSAYKTALCSPDFLYHVEPAGPLDDHSLAARLSYFLWNSMPDELLSGLADAGKLSDPAVTRKQVERLLADPRSQRFVEDFLGQWLKLRSINATDPDRKLYPEYRPLLGDSMVAETHAYFREMLDRDLPATHLVKSDFVMVNQRLATLYGIPGVEGYGTRRVPLPAGSPRGPFLTQASILKITANGTTTSPVPRGAFVMDRLLGRPPEPPPSEVPAVEPDVRGAKTIREQLDLHRNNPTCVSCHAKLDPPGFALESFDVIGGHRTRYRSIGGGDVPKPGTYDPQFGPGYRLGPAVDASGVLPDGRKFAGIAEFQDLLAAEPKPLLANLATQLSVYATGRAPSFADRPAMEELVDRTLAKGGGLRTLILEIVTGPLFRTR